MTSPNSTERRPTPFALPGRLLSWRQNIQTVALAVLLALFIRSFVAEARYIPSGSMLPTLQVDDRLIVEKLSYEFQKPDRAQVIVFVPPRNTHIEQAFIKRVIGLPGDTIAVHGGRVIVNGKPLHESYIAAPPSYEMPARRVPPGKYFVMGDNRNNSYDSHMWGFLPRENVIGRALFRFWPLERIGPIS